MGDTLHKMQVIIEATTSPLKKEMENSRREVKKSVEEIQKETEKVKNPFKGMESKALQPVRNTLNKIREMLSRNPVKNFQIKAGIKVPTEEYQQLNSTIQKTQAQLNKYYERRDKMSDLGVDQESMSWRNLTQGFHPVSLISVLHCPSWPDTGTDRPDFRCIYRICRPEYLCRANDTFQLHVCLPDFHGSTMAAGYRLE